MEFLLLERAFKFILFDCVALVKKEDNQFGSVHLSVNSLQGQIWRKVKPLPVQGIGLCVCNHGAYVYNIAEVVDRIIIFS